MNSTSKRLQLHQETVKKLSDHVPDSPLACSIIQRTMVSLCPCIPPTESPNCNPTS